MAAASACSRRNTVRAAASSWAYRKRFEGATNREEGKHAVTLRVMDCGLVGDCRNGAGGRWHRRQTSKHRAAVARPRGTPKPLHLEFATEARRRHIWRPPDMAAEIAKA